jgi:hypothetical protein
MIKKDIVIYRVLIILGMLILLSGYLLEKIEIIYMFAMALLFGHALRHWNDSQYKK